MGVPKFFRWLSERYPKINQRAGYLPDEETCYRHFDKPPPVPLEQPDPLSTCGLPPPIDRLYIDMNGIIHGCSHKNSNPEDKEEDSVSQITNKEIFRNVCFYLDRIVGDIAKPTELIYMAIDGVAPRAKLNQQRSRRYRSSREGMIERTVYEAHMHSLEQARLQAARADADPATTGIMGSFLASLPSRLSSDEVQEVEPGRYAGKFETEDDSSVESGDDDLFHSNSITPGTPFFEDCTRHIEHFIRYKLTHDPKWQHLTIIFSGPNVPGEGEHKIMEFIRKEKYRKDYNPNLRHCIMGQDGDLIMLGLVTHEPNLVLLREQVIFEMDRRMALERHSKGVDMYIYNANFEWLHMNILRDYLAFEFETRGVVPDNEFDLEPTIDDFVFLTFFVGNDFLPHMPALDIADEAFELLFATYKRLRWKWLKDKKRPPYLTNSGDIVSGKRLEQFLSAVGSYEDPYHYNKESESKDRIESWRKQDKRRGTFRVLETVCSFSILSADSC
jgi:5'-3' exonuclease